MLSDPNFSSPANIDASVELRKDEKAYKARVSKLVEKSRKELPPGFEMPKAKPPVTITESYELPLSDDDLDADLPDDDEVRGSCSWFFLHKLTAYFQPLDEDEDEPEDD
jgi:ubiquitin-conjugating enzyme E2 R